MRPVRIPRRAAIPLAHRWPSRAQSRSLLIDPRSDDPLICAASANAPRARWARNDESMILIRGATRVADLYVTEFDRLFRDIANGVAM